MVIALKKKKDGIHCSLPKNTKNLKYLIRRNFREEATFRFLVIFSKVITYKYFLLLATGAL